MWIVDSVDDGGYVNDIVDYHVYNDDVSDVNDSVNNCDKDGVDDGVKRCW